ncbi:MAG: SGNH/GDSL hydrolase family protein, partial [Anaerolineae bacterium]|nr:SGNH/GDSL hydrolase family protein [Anaerolineae bacterium]
MPFKSLSKNHIRLLGLALMLAGLLLNVWTLTALFSSDGILSPRSVVIIWIADVVLVLVGLVLALSGSLGTLLNALIGVIFTALLLYGIELFYYRLNHPSTPPEANAAPPPAISREGDYTQDFTHPDELLGYVVRPDAQIHSIKKMGDEVIYDVVYTTDSYHRRITPVDNPEQRDKFMLFFGDSFTFGEGVHDNETLPYYVAQDLPDYMPYNYGLSGYGPQQMLAKLQSDDLATEVTESDGIAIYIFIDAHV